jgi:hypothetical protein
MRNLLVGVVSCLVALVGFASMANAGATIDLLFGGTSPTTSGSSSSIYELHVVLTAGPEGSQGAGVTIDYSAGNVSVVSISNNPNAMDDILPLVLGSTTDTGTQVRNINAASFPPTLGTGLASGQSYLLGTITFHHEALFGTHVISPVLTATDGILDLNGNLINDTSTFNSATVIGPPPPCDATIEINALRGGSPNVGVPGTKNITAKALLQKGTGPTDQTLNNTSLIIEAFDGAVLVDSQMSPDLLTLVLGKGGQGDKLTMSVSQCDSGFIDFFATFTGETSTNGSICSETSRMLRKTCN